MLNSVILVGRLVETPVIKSFEESKYALLTLAVNRPFKNMHGEIEVDFIKCITWDAIAKSSCDYCRKGDIIAIRGRLATRNSDITFNKDGEVFRKKITNLEVIGERVVFIMTSGQKELDEYSDNL